MILECVIQYLEILEQERLKNLAEEEEIKRLRKELVPHAQLMPFFEK